MSLRLLCCLVRVKLVSTQHTCACSFWARLPVCSHPLTLYRLTSATSQEPHATTRTLLCPIATPLWHNKQATTMDPRKARPPNPTIDQNAFKGKKPNKVISVPVGFRRPTYAREREQIVSDVKASTGCAVIPHWNYKRDQDQSIIYQFDIFGTGTALEKAVRHINQWISKAQNKTKDSSAWAKTPAFDSNKWYYEQVDDMKQRHKQSFKEAPSEDSSLEMVGISGSPKNS